MMKSFVFHEARDPLGSELLETIFERCYSGSIQTGEDQSMLPSLGGDFGSACWPVKWGLVSLMAPMIAADGFLRQHRACEIV